MRRVLRRWILGGGILAVGMAIAIGVSMGGGNLLAQVANQLTEESSTMKKRATVTELLKNDHDDVDGLQLDSGDRVHFPPHMGPQITAIVKVGNQVEVEGRPEVTPKGERVFEISQITSGKETVRIAHPRPKHGPKAKHDEEPMTAQGKVAEYASNPHGDVDGLILKDGTVVKFPPHQSSELQELVQVGDEVKIEGRRHVTPHGDVHLHADVVTANGQSVERDGPKHGPKPPRHAVRAGGPEEPTNAEILHELREIRKLLSEPRK